MQDIIEIRAYFNICHERSEAVEPLRKSCHDCAVTSEYYLEHAECLSRLTPEEIKYHSFRWFCHNNRNRACAGNIEYQEKVK